MFDLFAFGFAHTNPPATPGGPLPPEELEEQPEDIKDEINEVVTNVMPWLFSFGVHLAIVIVAVFVVWFVRVKVPDEEKIIGELQLGPTPGVQLVVDKENKEEKQSSSRRTTARRVRRTESTINSQSQVVRSQLGMAGGPPATASPFGTGPNVGEGFSVGLFGNGGNARSVAFVIDASGSLFDTMPFVIDELKQSIGKLSAGHTFTVIFFQDGKVIECVHTKGMRPADAETKQKVIQWIDLSRGNVSPKGRTDPVDAIKLALAHRPQVMYLLSDNIVGTGRFGILPDVLVEEVKKANPGNQTKINTIQFIYPDELAKLGQEPTLKRISDATGGRYKFVSEDDLHSR